jgi:hypothetical protein
MPILRHCEPTGRRKAPCRVRRSSCSNSIQPPKRPILIKAEHRIRRELFHPVGWSGSVRKGPIDPAIFIVVRNDSILSPALPANYQKVDSPLVTCITSLKYAIELNKKDH